MDMKENIVREDRGKLLLYTLLHLCLTIFLMLLTIYVYGSGHFLLAFLSITGLWFSVKAMCRYGFRLVKNTPVCEFKRDEVILPALPKEQRHLKYRDIRAVKILRSSSSVKLFFSGDHVTHPSGWQYAGAVYLFQRKKLNDVQKYAMDCLHTHHISFEVVQKAES